MTAKTPPEHQFELRLSARLRRDVTRKVIMRTALLALFLSGFTTLALGSAAHAQNGVACGRAGSIRHLEVVLLSADQRLLCYREGSHRMRSLGAISGLNPGESL